MKIYAIKIGAAALATAGAIAASVFWGPKWIGTAPADPHRADNATAPPGESPTAVVIPAEKFKTMKDEEMSALGEHYAKQAPAKSDEPIDDALVKRGRDIANAKLCASCHLPMLAGQNQIPRLARQRVDYLTQSLKAFRDGTRPGADTLMSGVLAGLSDADLVALAHYAASH